MPRDPKFNEEGTTQLLLTAGAKAVERVED